jgi:hypothetical protein
MKILLADDHALLKQGLAFIIKDIFPHNVGCISDSVMHQKLEIPKVIKKRCMTLRLYTLRLLNFKDIFRYAAKYDLISLEESERWLIYRNNTAHDYGVKFADEILASLPQFLIDATHIHDIIRG